MGANTVATQSKVQANTAGFNNYVALASGRMVATSAQLPNQKYAAKRMPVVMKAAN